MFEPYRPLPAALKPAYFDAIINGSEQVLRRAMLDKMGSLVCGSGFANALAASSVCFVGECGTALLPRLAPSVLQSTTTPIPLASLSPALYMVPLSAAPAPIRQRPMAKATQVVPGQYVAGFFPSAEM